MRPTPSNTRGTHTSSDRKMLETCKESDRAVCLESALLRGQQSKQPNNDPDSADMRTNRHPNIEFAMQKLCCKCVVESAIGGQFSRPSRAKLSRSAGHSAHHPLHGVRRRQTGMRRVSHVRDTVDFGRFESGHFAAYSPLRELGTAIAPFNRNNRDGVWYPGSVQKKTREDDVAVRERRGAKSCRECEMNFRTADGLLTAPAGRAIQLPDPSTIESHGKAGRDHLPPLVT